MKALPIGHPIILGIGMQWMLVLKEI